jgi:hypothetical protein
MVEGMSQTELKQLRQQLRDIFDRLDAFESERRLA